MSNVWSCFHRYYWFEKSHEKLSPEIEEVCLWILSLWGTEAIPYPDTVSVWMVETSLREKRRARQMERGNSHGASHEIKHALSSTFSRIRNSGWSFTNVEEMKLHVWHVHLEVKEFKCQVNKVCWIMIILYTKWSKTSSAKVTILHIKFVHDQIKDNKCLVCDLSTKIIGDLQKHIKSSHLNECHVKLVHC